MVVDQATRLREIVRTAQPAARTITVTSGKGGVGKTNLAINLAIAGAATGKNILVFDADLGLANIDLLLNVRTPYNLSHVIRGERCLLETIVQAPGNIQIVPGVSGLSEMADLSDDQRDALIRNLEQLESAADVILIDTGAGISKNVINFALASDETLVVSSPEPTSITDAYATIKTLALHGDHGPIRLVVNMATDAAEGERVLEQIVRVCQDFLGVYVEKAGWVLADPTVGTAVRRRSPFLLEYPHCAASTSLKKVARNFFVAAGPATTRRGGFFKKLSSLFRGA